MSNSNDLKLDVNQIKNGMQMYIDIIKTIDTHMDSRAEQEKMLQILSIAHSLFSRGIRLCVNAYGKESAKETFETLLETLKLEFEVMMGGKP